MLAKTLSRRAAFGMLIGAMAVSAPPAPAEDEARELRALVETLRRDRRGPFQAIRWFCPDGSVRPAQQPCDQPGGRQHGLLKDEVRRWHARGLYLGQVLAGLEFAEFWDAQQRNSRAKQYPLEAYLQANDDGWIMQRGRYYRGAVQAEDEEAWSNAFLVWLAAQDAALASHYFVVRELSGSLPRSRDAGLATRVRGLAKLVADADPGFGDLRVKIHGRPDAGDATRVAAWRESHAARLRAEQVEQLRELERCLRQLYQVGGDERLRGFVERLPAGDPVGERLRGVLAGDAEARDGLARRVEQLAELMWLAREAIQTPGTPASRRVLLLDLSRAAEAALMLSSARWQPSSLRELLRQNRALAQAVAAVGLLEQWEWRHLDPVLASPSEGDALSVAELARRARFSRRAVEWAAGMIRAVWGPEVDRWSAFEPKAHGVIDDRTRASPLLLLGGASAQLAELAAARSGQSNSILDPAHQSEVRGLNPGMARGRLRVLDPGAAEPEFEPDRIYVLLRPPAEMKPVAGIASVSEGNLVSHVQLLARNLGIPNAVFSPRALAQLAARDGQDVFYAVSPRGVVLMKPAAEMTAAERAALSLQSGTEERMTAPIDRLRLESRQILQMGALGADDSGRVCGPKAANLGVLHQLFPGSVPPGLVIPFGVFGAHLEQPLPGGGGSYWDAVNRVFSRDDGDAALAEGLAGLRRSIREIPFRDGFVAELESRFHDWLGHELGEVAVFIRSDTNMEDLEGFTGAGLNLTVPNVREPGEVLQAIRDVWASPFSERSYQWRSRALTNPAQVYPSIVILPSVSVDKSGVLITTGIVSGEPADDTVAFNWGGTGAVGGQAAETWLFQPGGRDVLLFPAREADYTRLVPGGGLEQVAISFERPVLSEGERSQIRSVAELVRQRLPGTRGLSSGPYDVELGFWDDRLWLFQVRRFVERGPGRATTYLMGLDRAASGEWPPVSLDAPLELSP